jgi:hypothetical protein
MIYLEKTSRKLYVSLQPNPTYSFLQEILLTFAEAISYVTSKQCERLRMQATRLQPLAVHPRRERSLFSSRKRRLESQE